MDSAEVSTSDGTNPSRARAVGCTEENGTQEIGEAVHPPAVERVAHATAA